MYANDYDERLPPKEAWMDTCIPYVKSEEVFHCPFVEEKYDDKSLYGYCFNMELSSTDLRSIQKPSDAPLVFESMNLGRNAWGTLASLPKPGWANGKVTIAYADAHVERVVP